MRKADPNPVWRRCKIYKQERRVRRPSGVRRLAQAWVWGRHALGMFWVHRWLEVWTHIGQNWEFLSDSLQIVDFRLFTMVKGLQKGCGAGKQCFQEIHLAESRDQLPGNSKTSGVTGLHHRWQGTWKGLTEGTFRKKLSALGNRLDTCL